LSQPQCLMLNKEGGDAMTATTVHLAVYDTLSD
jgi:hypothetical protein